MMIYGSISCNIPWTSKHKAIFKEAEVSRFVWKVIKLTLSTRPHLIGDRLWEKGVFFLNVSPFYESKNTYLAGNEFLLMDFSPKLLFCFVLLCFVST